ncbi:hypothetical protein [Okeania sp. KiyG1]|nr:hypothetical protein [Okeania sp. KiyG1]
MSPVSYDHASDHLLIATAMPSGIIGSIIKNGFLLVWQWIINSQNLIVLV